METGLPEKRGGTNQFSDERDTLRTAARVIAPSISLSENLGKHNVDKVQVNVGKSVLFFPE